MDGLREGDTLTFEVYKVICHYECYTDRTFFSLLRFWLELSAFGALFYEFTSPFSFPFLLF